MYIPLKLRHYLNRLLAKMKHELLRPKYLTYKNTFFSDLFRIGKFQSPFVFTSELCKSSHFALPLYQYWCSKLKEEPCLRRKQWEFIYIIQSLHERGFLTDNSKGLGFGVGQEQLPALFASMGCKITATDAPVEISTDWYNTNQHIGFNISKLNDRKICNEEVFRKNVDFEFVDMNNIPEKFQDYDFCWSACAFEHLGSIEKGLEFVENSLKCLRPGGLAIHTSEYNLSSNDQTFEHSSLVLFRKQDYEKLIKRLESNGHYVYPITFSNHDGPIDEFIDLPPYFRKGMHLKLLIGRHVTTSIGLIIQKNEI